jgi:uncharacterized repeat protein (TIGR01451 family)
VLKIPVGTQALGEADPYPSNIFVSGLNGTISSLSVTLSGLSYTDTQDLYALLVGPGGKTILLSGVGQATAISDVNLTIDDAAPNLIPGVSNPVSSSYQPTDYSGVDTNAFASPAPLGPYPTPAPAGSGTLASAFNGTAPDGTWSLFLMSSDATLNSGELAGGWSLDFTTVNDADLSITNTDNAGGTFSATTNNTSGGAVVSGNAVLYSIVVANTGPTAVSGASIVDNMPAGIIEDTWTTTLVGGATVTSTAEFGNINDNDVNLPVGASVTYSIDATVNPSENGSLVDTATLTAPSGITDTNAFTSSTDTMTAAPFVPPSSQLNLQVSDNVGGVIIPGTGYTAGGSTVPGSEIKYTITLGNGGPDSSDGVSIDDDFPAALSNVSWTAAVSGGAGVSQDSGTGNIDDTDVALPVDSDVTYSVDATISPSATGILSDSVAITPAPGVTDSNVLTSSTDEVELISVAQAVADTTSIDVSESTSPATVLSATSASGNVLLNDTGLSGDPSSITSISDAKNPSGVTPSTNGVITIDSGIGTLTTDTTGPDAGDYSYSLDSGVVPSCSGASDVFSYTITDASSYTSSATLTVSLSCTLVTLAHAVNDSGSIDVAESTSPAAILSATTDSGNLLLNDTGLSIDPATITSVSDTSSGTRLPDGNGLIEIDGAHGILSLHTTGPDAGDYSYSLFNGVVPACTGATDLFTYSLTDSYAQTSEATLTETLDVSCTPPATVTSVSTTQPAGSFRAGAVIPIDVIFNGPVTVTGTPELALNDVESAGYVAGSGTNVLVFDYTVAPGDNVDPLDYTSISALNLNGGAIKDSVDNNANAQLPSPGGTADFVYAAGLDIDTTAPVVTLTQVNGVAVTFPYASTHAITSLGGACGVAPGDASTLSVTLNAVATLPATANCVGGNWTLTLTTPLTVPTSYTFVASQSDAAGNVGQSGSKQASVTTTPEVSTTSMNIAKGNVTYGAETVQTINGVVTGVKGDGAPEGTVNITYGASSAPLCSATLVPGTANTSTYKCALGSNTQLAAANYLTVRAAFVPAGVSSTNGAFSYTKSSSGAFAGDNFLVKKDSSTVKVSLSPASVTVGSESTVVFSVTVSTANSEPVPNTETVTVHVGSVSCVVTLVAGKGTCTIANNALVAGTYSVSATYASDANLGSSSATATTKLTVKKG